MASLGPLVSPLPFLPSPLQDQLGVLDSGLYLTLHYDDSASTNEEHPHPTSLLFGIFMLPSGRVLLGRISTSGDMIESFWHHLVLEQIRTSASYIL